MALNLRHGTEQGSLPFSAMDAMAMWEGIAIALAKSSESKAQGAKVPTFLHELHKAGFTVTPVPMIEMHSSLLEYTPTETGQGNQP